MIRERTPKIIITFESTHTAIKMETYCKEHRLPGRIIPVPGSVHAGCGLCWCIRPEEEEAVCRQIKEAGLPYEGIYRVSL